MQKETKQVGTIETPEQLEKVYPSKPEKTLEDVLDIVEKVRNDEEGK